MSFNSKINTAVERLVAEFVQQVSNKYNIDNNELMAMWTGNNQVKTNSTMAIDMNDLSMPRLLKLNKTELSALCKQHNMKCTGKKEELLERLTGSASLSEPVKKKPVPRSEQAKPSGKVFEQLIKNSPVLSIRKNKFGHHVNAQTGLVFDPKTLQVIAKETENGQLTDLTDADIEVCKQHRFAYKLPKNLDQGNLDDVKIDEVDEVDEVEVEEEKVDVEEDEDEDEEVEVEDEEEKELEDN